MDAAGVAVTFHGVRGSTPCDGPRLARYGGNTSCVAVEAEGQSPIVFDLQCRLVSGPHAGQPVTSRFPAAARLDVERYCETVLAGRAARFPCVWDGTPIVFEGLPVRSADGGIVYGLLVPAGAPTGIVAAV